MDRVGFDELEPAVSDAEVKRLGLTAGVGTEHVAINHYQVPAGEGLPSGLHAHYDQEEVFVVLAGEATFETLREGEVTVGARAAIRFAPGEYQSGRNDGDRPLELLALGAPPDTTDTRIPFPCPDCGCEALRLKSDGETLVFDCPDCGAVHPPAACPACDGEALHATLNEAEEPIVACRGCGATYDAPPLDG